MLAQASGPRVSSAPGYAHRGDRVQDYATTSPLTAADHRRRLRELVGADELRGFTEVSLKRTSAYIALHWLSILVLLAAANATPALPLPLAIPAAIVLVLLIGTRVNAASVLIHEASHGLLASPLWLNDLLCNALVASWTLHSVDEYRPAHQLHHRWLHGDADPDRDYYLLPVGRWSRLAIVCQDLFWITAVKRGLVLLSTREHSVPGGMPKDDLRAGLLRLAMKAACQLVLLAGFVAVQGDLVRGIAFYVIFWLVPVLSIFPLLLRLKTVTEHFHPDLRRSDVGELFVSRSSTSTWLEEYLIGAKMEYHFEHHLLPTIPYHGLRKLHRRLLARGFFDRLSRGDRARALSGGYLHFARHFEEPAPTTDVRAA
jgi:fatty acid desaturase